MRRNKKENGTEDRLPITKRALVRSLAILATQQWVVSYTENLTHTTFDRYMAHSLKNTLTGKKKLELKSPQSELIKTAIDGQDAYSRESATHELTEYSANKLLYAASQNAELQKEIDEQLRLGKLDWQTTGSAHVFEEKEVLSQRANITLMSTYGNEPVKLQVYYRQDRLTANAEASRGAISSDDNLYEQQLEVTIVDPVAGDDLGLAGVRREVRIPDGEEGGFYMTKVVYDQPDGYNVFSTSAAVIHAPKGGIYTKTLDSKFLSSQDAAVDKTQRVFNDIATTSELLRTARLA